MANLIRRKRTPWVRLDLWSHVLFLWGGPFVQCQIIVNGDKNLGPKSYQLLGIKQLHGTTSHQKFQPPTFYVLYSGTQLPYIYPPENHPRSCRFWYTGMPHGFPRFLESPGDAGAETWFLSFLSHLLGKISNSRRGRGSKGLVGKTMIKKVVVCFFFLWTWCFIVGFVDVNIFEKGFGEDEPILIDMVFRWVEITSL